MKITTIILIAAIALTPTCNAQLAVSSTQSGSSYCDSMPIAAVAALVGTGAFQFCMHYTKEYSRVGDVFNVLATISGPAIAGSAVVFSIPVITGCTNGAITQFVGVLGTTALGYAHFTVTSTARTCSGIGSWAITVGGVTTPYRVEFHATTAEQTIEQWPTLNVAGELDIHQDPLSGTLEICPETAPCFGELEVHQDPICTETAPCFHEINSTVDVSIMGNVSINQTNLPPPPEPGFNGSLYILILVVIMALVHIGETRKDNVYRAAAAFLLLLAPFIMLWEREQLGFNHIFDGNGLRLALPFVFIHWAIATYLAYPKDYEESEKDSQKKGGKN